MAWAFGGFEASPWPKDLKGEKRPADAVARAVMIGRIATGEIEDRLRPSDAAAASMGAKGGAARARLSR